MILRDLESHGGLLEGILRVTEDLELGQTFRMDLESCG